MSLGVEHTPSQVGLHVTPRPRSLTKSRPSGHRLSLSRTFPAPVALIYTFATQYQLVHFEFMVEFLRFFGPQHIPFSPLLTKLVPSHDLLVDAQHQPRRCGSANRNHGSTYTQCLIPGKKRIQSGIPPENRRLFIDARPARSLFPLHESPDRMRSSLHELCRTGPTSSSRRPTAKSSSFNTGEVGHGEVRSCGLAEARAQPSVRYYRFEHTNRRSGKQRVGTLDNLPPPSSSLRVVRFSLISAALLRHLIESRTVERHSLS
jgi:hypothetical protein